MKALFLLLAMVTTANAGVSSDVACKIFREAKTTYDHYRKLPADAFWVTMGAKAGALPLMGYTVKKTFQVAGRSAAFAENALADLEMKQIIVKSGGGTVNIYQTMLEDFALRKNYTWTWDARVYGFKTLEPALQKAVEAEFIAEQTAAIRSVKGFETALIGAGGGLMSGFLFGLAVLPDVFIASPVSSGTLTEYYEKNPLRMLPEIENPGWACEQFKTNAKLAEAFVKNLDAMIKKAERRAGATDAYLAKPKMLVSAMDGIHAVLALGAAKVDDSGAPSKATNSKPSAQKANNYIAITPTF